MRLHRYRRLVGLAALGAAALAVFVLAYFEPQKLFIDERVAEAPPTATAVKTLSAGTFRSYEHATSGRARVIATAGGRRYVRFEDFETSNGPALKVYLSAAPASGPGDGFDDRFVDLGDLKGNIGSQNYAIPADVRLDRYRSVVVWCKRFSVPFAAAPYELSAEAPRRSGDRPDAKAARRERRVTPESHQGLRPTPDPGDPDGNRTK